MRDERLHEAQKFLRQQGHELPDETVLGLLAAIKGKREKVYEKGDFVFYNMGMGEAGHGTVTKVEANAYKVDTWTPNEKIHKSYPHHVGAGDMIGLSNEREAQTYWIDRGTPHGEMDIREAKKWLIDLLRVYPDFNGAGLGQDCIKVNWTSDDLPYIPETFKGFAVEVTITGKTRAL